MKITNEKELLDLFVGKTEIREIFHSPFRNLKDNGNIWASDASILCILSAEAAEGEYEDDSLRKPDFLVDNVNKILSLSDIEAALDKAPLIKEVVETQVKCEDCDGDGIVFVDYHAKDGTWYHDIEIDCPVCDGIGKYTDYVATDNLVYDNTKCIKIGDVAFLPKYIDILAKAMKLVGTTVLKMIKEGESNHDVRVFSLTKDVTIYLMPINNYYEGIEICAEIPLNGEL